MNLNQKFALFVFLQYCFRQTFSFFHIYNNNDFQITKFTTTTKIMNATMSKKIKVQTIFARILKLNNRDQRRSEKIKRIRDDSNSNIHVVKIFLQHDAFEKKMQKKH